MKGEGGKGFMDGVEERLLLSWLGGGTSNLWP